MYSSRFSTAENNYIRTHGRKSSVTRGNKNNAELYSRVKIWHNVHTNNSNYFLLRSHHHFRFNAILAFSYRSHVHYLYFQYFLTRDLHLEVNRELIRHAILIYLLVFTATYPLCNYISDRFSIRGTVIIKKFIYTANTNYDISIIE